MVLIAVLLVLLLLVLLLLLTNVQITIGYRENTSFSKVRIGGVLLTPKQKDRAKETETSKKPQDSGSFLKKVKGYRAFYSAGKKVLRKALKRGGKKLRIEYLEFLYVGGFEDAAATALVYGTVSGLVYEVYAMLQQFIGVEQTKIQLLPEFQTKGVRVETEWRLSFRVWHLFYVGSALLPLLFIKKRA